MSLSNRVAAKTLFDEINAMFVRANDCEETLKENIKSGRDKKVAIALRVWHRANTVAPTYGYVGVGCITYAERRLARASDLLGLGLKKE